MECQALFSGIMEKSRDVRKRTFGHVSPVKIQISLRIRAAWSVSSLGAYGYPVMQSFFMRLTNPASILYKSIAGRYRPVSYPDGPITARYRFIKNAYWEVPDWSTRI